MVLLLLVICCLLIVLFVLAFVRSRVSLTFMFVLIVASCLLSVVCCLLFVRCLCVLFERVYFLSLQLVVVLVVG